MPRARRPLGTLIVRAAERAPGHVVETLVAHGASVDAIDGPATAIDGIARYTALHAAAWHGNTSAADALLRLGASPRVRDGKYGATAAGWADFAGHRDTCARILEADVDVFDAIACGTPARVVAILDAIRRPWTGRWVTTAAAPKTPRSRRWPGRLERDKPEMVALLQARGARPPTP